MGVRIRSSEHFSCDYSTHKVVDFRIEPFYFVGGFGLNGNRTVVDVAVPVKVTLVDYFESLLSLKLQSEH